MVKAELFPTEVRALGVGLPYALTVSIFGGTAEYIALWFKDIGHGSWFYWYVTGCIAVLVAGLRLHARHQVGLEDRRRVAAVIGSRPRRPVRRGLETVLHVVMHPSRLTARRGRILLFAAVGVAAAGLSLAVQGWVLR